MLHTTFNSTDRMRSRRRNCTKRRFLVSLGIALLVICIAVESVSAYVRFNPKGPDRLLFPGYQWMVKADGSAEQTLCLRWTVNHSESWSYTPCSQAETNSNVWLCTIPDEIADARVTYQFYKASIVGQCDPAGDTSEWTSKHSFDTVCDSVTLNRPNMQDPLLRTGLISLLWVICGAITIIWRHYRR